MTSSDVTLCSWNSPAPSAGNTGFYLSRSVSAKQSGWQYRICELVQERVYTVQTLYKYLSATPTAVTMQRLEAAPHWHMDKHVKKRHRQSS